MLIFFLLLYQRNIVWPNDRAQILLGIYSQLNLLLILHDMHHDRTQQDNRYQELLIFSYLCLVLQNLFLQNYLTAFLLMYIMNS